MIFRRAREFKAAGAARPVWQQGTEAFRGVLIGAREEAVHLGHDWVGTEHVLLALTDSKSEKFETLLSALGVTRERIRSRVESKLASVRYRSRRQASKRGGGGDAREIPYTNRAKRVLELAAKHAKHFQTPMDVEHLLLGLLEEGDGVAATSLDSLGVRLDDVLRLIRADELASSSATRRKPFRVRIDDASDQSIYEQIISRIREGIATGQLRADDRLPTVRQLADELDVAPGTVARAYAELERGGLVATEGARGTRVASRGQTSISDAERPKVLVDLLRPVSVAAYHMGATAPELRDALAAAMRGIFGPQ